MPLQLPSLVKETFTTTGTGTITLAGAVSGFRAFTADMIDTDTVPYMMADAQTGWVNWEIGIGTLSTGAGTLARSVLLSSNANALVNWGAGTKFVWAIMPGETQAGKNVQMFTASGTWTKPIGAQLVNIVAIGRGGGGGSGRRGAAASVRTGGGGGGAGGLGMLTLSASILGATEAVTVPAVASGGAAIGADNTNGNAGGSAFEVTSFGAWLSVGGAQGGAGGAAAAAAGGFGGSAMCTFAGGTGATSDNVGGAGPAGGSTFNIGGVGGGAGGGITAANAANNGGAGGSSCGGTSPFIAGTAGTAPGGAGGNGGGAATGNPIGGSGGGGGAGGTTVGGNGGNGANYGGGGGGGGASLNGNNSGAGGNGGPGLLIVYAK